ncbi:MAG: 5'/3'-nucleotidase SurE [Clostridia bacterium]|nr:5'/3'-nucleotidase SurE [Clostridia bacterium]
MRVLLTNDDGVYAEGLHALRRTIEASGRHEVFTVAPERERSAIGHAITLHKPLQVRSVTMADAASPIWSVNGTPADCAKIGVLALLDRPPDVLVSGINRGANVGMDVLYSGTVSAAIEGTILGIASIAVSLAAFDEGDYDFAARFTLQLIEHVGQGGLPAGVLLNVNVPDLQPTEIAGVAATRIGRRYYADVFHPARDPRGRTYYWLAGEVRRGEEPAETDIGALERNLISITPVRLALTDTSLLERVGRWAAELERSAVHGEA